MRTSLVSLLFLLSAPVSVQADLIEFELDYTLGSVSGDFGEGQTMGGIGTFFTDDAFVFGLGDTLVFDIIFDSALHVYDFGDPSLEYFSFALNILPSSPSFSGTWTSSIEALGASGDIWSGAITKSWQGGGAGFGWGGSGINITDSSGTFTGIRWTTTLTSAFEGDPMTLYAYTGVQMGADGITVTSVPEPGTLALFGIGLAGLAASRRSRRKAI